MGATRSRNDVQVHAERNRALGELEADGAQTDHADSPAQQPGGLLVASLVPTAGTKVGDVVGNVAVDRQQEAEGELGNRDRVLARNVAHVDATIRCGRNVDRVRARARANNEP